MSGALLSHEARQRVPGAAVLAVILAAFGLLALVIADVIGDLLAAITEGMPPAFDIFLGANAPGGYAVGEMFSLIFPVSVVTFAVIVGAGALAGEERDGTMAILSAQPVSRIRLFWAKALGVLGAVILVVAVNWAAMGLFIASRASELTFAGLTGATVHLLFLGLAFGSIAFAVAGATGKPALGSAAAGGLAVASYLAATMLPIAGLTDWARLSPWHYYLGHSDPLRDGVNVGDVGLFAAIVVVCMSVAVVVFRRRDLEG
ncbi:ABC transporter permease subunit [Agrococcus sp. ProA11]|uniref:ABC transporter permease subunit n=1 Tax=Agrococcus chionoecetis TaxID=3153752 RepID=UPI00326110D6